MFSIKHKVPAIFTGGLAVLAWLGAGTAPSQATSPDGPLSPDFEVYAGCGKEAETPRSHVCHKGDPVGAFFRSRRADATYRVCVRFSPSQKQLCVENQPAPRGVLQINKITNGAVGEIGIRWWVGPNLIGRWTVGLYPDPVVSKFGVNPLILFGNHRLFGLLVKHGGNGSRVRAWRRCAGICPLRLRRVRKRGPVRRYVVAGNSRAARFRLGDVIHVLLDAPGQTDGHGLRIWGRLYTGRFIRDPRGGPRDTAIRHIGRLRCVPPGADFRVAKSCDRTSWEWP